MNYEKEKTSQDRTLFYIYTVSTFRVDKLKCYESQIHKARKKMHTEF
jgi:hypothetical protein